MYTVPLDNETVFETVKEVVAVLATLWPDLSWSPIWPPPLPNFPVVAVKPEPPESKATLQCENPIRASKWKTISTYLAGGPDAPKLAASSPPTKLLPEILSWEELVLLGWAASIITSTFV